VHYGNCPRKRKFIPATVHKQILSLTFKHKGLAGYAIIFPGQPRFNRSSLLSNIKPDTGYYTRRKLIKFALAIYFYINQLKATELDAGWPDSIL
jgi:hypothetical protein